MKEKVKWEGKAKEHQKDKEEAIKAKERYQKERDDIQREYNVLNGRSKEESGRLAENQYQNEELEIGRAHV